jgi:hypothetical protein
MATVLSSRPSYSVVKYHSSLSVSSGCITKACWFTIRNGSERSNRRLIVRQLNMGIREDVEFALQQLAAFYRSHQWSLRTNSFWKAHEETKGFPEEIRGKEVFDRFHSLYQEPLAALVEEAVGVFTGIVTKLPGTSIKERRGIVEQHVKNSIIQPNIRKGPVERWLMQASGCKVDPAVLIGVYEEKVESSWVAPPWLTSKPPKKAKRRGKQWFLELGDEHVPVKADFALRYNKNLDNTSVRLATSQLILELANALEARLMYVLDLNLKKMAATLLPDAEELEAQERDHKQSEQQTDLGEISDRLRYGGQCAQMVDEIRRVQRMYVDRGFSFEDIKAQTPDFLLWSRVLPHLEDDDKETFIHPGRWARRGDGGITGYAHRVLAIVYSKSPATIQDWIKEFKLHQRQTAKNP